jgi:hypothetical protein
MTHDPARTVLAHPWHGVPARLATGSDVFNAYYIELVPTDVVKYELDKPAAICASIGPSCSRASVLPSMVSFHGPTAGIEWPDHGSLDGTGKHHWRRSSNG